MKHIKYIICAFAILFIWSCDSQGLEEVKALPEAQIAPAKVKSASTVVITKETVDAKEEFTFEWEPADFGYSAEVSYSIYLSGPTVSDYSLAENILDVSYAIEHKLLYDRLTNAKKLGLPKGQVSTVSVYVTATIGSDFAVVKSAPVNIDFNVPESIK